MKKTTLKSLAWLMMCLCALTFAACSGGDDDDSSSSNESSYTSSNNGSYSQTNLVGVWMGYSSDKTLAIVMGIYQNGTGDLYLFRQGTSDYEQIMNESMSYQFNTNSGELFVTYDSDNSTEKFRITNQTVNSFTLYVGDTQFYMERYTDDDGDGDSSSSQTGYAPEYVSDCTFKIVHIGNTYNIFFTSNNTIKKEYSNVPLYQTKVTGAKYTKTGANTARVEIDYHSESLNQDNTATFELTFTSETGGKSRRQNIDGTFTIEKEQRDDYISAPEDIEYKKFTTNSAGVLSKWWQFGYQYGNQTEIINYGGNATTGSSYYRHYATYSRNSNKSATLTIYCQAYEGLSTNSTTYNLEFQTSKSGRYSSSSYSSFTGKTTTLSGTFTLENNK